MAAFFSGTDHYPFGEGWEAEFLMVFLSEIIAQDLGASPRCSND